VRAKKINLVLIGDNDKQKSDIISAYTGEIKSYFAKHQKTVNFNSENIELILSDTAGEGSLTPIAFKSAYADTDVFMLTFSLNDRNSLANVPQLADKIRSINPKAPIILVGANLEKRYGKEAALPPIAYTEGTELQKVIGAISYFECDAISKRGVPILFEGAIKAIISPANVLPATQEDKKEKPQKKVDLRLPGRKDRKKEDTSSSSDEKPRYNPYTIEPKPNTAPDNRRIVTTAPDNIRMVTPNITTPSPERNRPSIKVQMPAPNISSPAVIAVQKEHSPERNSPSIETQRYAPPPNRTTIALPQEPSPNISSPNMAARDQQPVVTPSPHANKITRKAPFRIDGGAINKAKEEEKIRKNILKIDDVINKIKMSAKKIQDTRKLEADTMFTPADEIDKGAIEENSLYSYGILLQSFMLLNIDKLKDDEIEAITKNIKIIWELQKDRNELRLIEQNPAYQFSLKREYVPSHKNFYTYSKDLDAFAARKYREFEQNGETYTIGGVRRHFEVIKYAKVEFPKNSKNFDPHQTTYNSGLEAEFLARGLDLVKGTLEKKIKNNTPQKITDLMRTNAEKKIHEHEDTQIDKANHRVLKQEADSYLGQEVRSRLVPQQHKGNCTTRSLREMLRDNLSEKHPQLFKDIHKFISKPFDNDSIDLIGYLVEKKTQLEERLPSTPNLNHYR
jgi:hypothetical protein